MPTDPTQAVDDLYRPCHKTDPEAIEMTWMEVPWDKLLEPPISFSYFQNSLNNTRPTVNESDLKQFVKFTEDFGGQNGE